MSRVIAGFAVDFEAVFQVVGYVDCQHLHLTDLNEKPHRLLDAELDRCEQFGGHRTIENPVVHRQFAGNHIINRDRIVPNDRPFPALHDDEDAAF